MIQYNIYYLLLKVLDFLLLLLHIKKRICHEKKDDGENLSDVMHNITKTNQFKTELLAIIMIIKTMQMKNKMPQKMLWSTQKRPTKVDKFIYSQNTCYIWVISTAFPDQNNENNNKPKWMPKVCMWKNKSTYKQITCLKIVVLVHPVHYK